MSRKANLVLALLVLIIAGLTGAVVYGLKGDPAATPVRIAPPNTPLSEKTGKVPAPSLAPTVKNTPLPSPFPFLSPVPPGLPNQNFFCPNSGLASFLKTEHFSALQPSFRQDQDLEKVKSLYEIKASIDPENASYQGQLNLTFVNSAPQAMPVIMLRTYPDFYKAEGGQLLLEEALINGRPARLYDRAFTYQAVIPEVPIPACSVANLSLKFSGKLATQLKEEDYAVGTFYTGQGFFALGNFYPQLAVWEKTTGSNTWDWTISPVRPSSDLGSSQSAFFEVELATPADYQVVASGTSPSENRLEANFRSWHFVGGPLREFAAVGSNNFSPEIPVKTSLGKVKVKVFTLKSSNPEITNRQQDFARKALEATVTTLDEFGAVAGQYPFLEYSLVESPLVGFNGVEWPMFSQFSQDLFRRNYTGEEQNYGTIAYSKPGTLVAIHEVLHQWWYNLVGNDQQNEPFIDEGLTEYCAYLIPELWARSHNAPLEQARSFARGWLDKLRNRVRQGDLPLLGDLKVNTPASEVSLEQAGFIYYRKAPLFYEAFRAKFGDTAFFRFISSYLQKFRYGFVHYPDLAGLLAASAPGREEEARAFTNQWLNEKNLVADLGPG